MFSRIEESLRGMLPIHRTRLSVYNYEDIPAGYYFEAMKSGHSVQRFWHQKKFTDVAQGLPEAGHILDVGCSAGSFLEMMMTVRPDLTAVGVDIASAQIAFAKKNVEPFHNGRVQFILLDEKDMSLPFPDASFDAITSIEVIEHIHPHIALRMLMEARRLLKPGGRLIVTTPNYRSSWPLIEWALEKTSPVQYHEQHINKYTPNSLVKFLECAGFQVGSVRSLFVVAPFLAGLSWKFAERVMALEKRFSFLLGSLLVAEATVDPVFATVSQRPVTFTEPGNIDASVRKASFRDEQESVFH